MFSHKKSQSFFGAGGWSGHLGQTRQGKIKQHDPNLHIKKLWILPWLSCFMQEGQTEEEGAASQMCFSLYASCQHGRGLIKFDWPKFILANRILITR